MTETREITFRTNDPKKMKITNHEVIQQAREYIRLLKLLKSTSDYQPAAAFINRMNIWIQWEIEAAEHAIARAEENIANGEP